MKSKFLLVFLFLGILNCEAQYSNANPYDYLELALRWPNSYCLTHEGGCREIVPQYFTISYLHPRKRGGPDLQNCPTPFNLPNSTIEANKNDLLKFWPDLRTDNFIESKSLWRNQWKKFGSCYSLRPADYIIYALNNRKNNDLKTILKRAGIVPSGNAYPTRRILQAFRKVLGVNVDIVCEPDRSGNVYLAEVHQCVDASGTTPIDCDNKARGCDDEPIYPYMGFEPDKDPNGNPYPTRRILQAFRKALSVNVDIVCEPDRGGNIYLGEVHQCVDVYGTKPIDCDNKARGCDDDPFFPYIAGPRQASCFLITRDVKMG